MRRDENQPSHARFGRAQDEHDHGEDGARQGQLRTAIWPDRQRPVRAQAGKREQREDNGPDLIAVAADGEGVVQAAKVLR